MFYPQEKTTAHVFSVKPMYGVNSTPKKPDIKLDHKLIMRLVCIKMIKYPASSPERLFVEGL